MVLRFYDKNKNVIGVKLYIPGRHNRLSLFRYTRAVIKQYFNGFCKHITLTNF
jgi:hypothetical protein